VHAEAIDVQALLTSVHPASTVFCVGEGQSRAGLTAAEERLLPLLATPLSLGEIAALLERPRDEIEVRAVAIYSKLGLRSNDNPD
jgi:DNA-binding NarL/FixJ family response regulator